MNISFEGVSRPVSVNGCEDIISLFAIVLRDWPHQLSRSSQPSVIQVFRTKEGYTRTSPWLDEPKTYTDLVDAVCDFVVDLVNAYMEERSDLLFLHCAAAVFPTGVTLLLSDYEGGKSTLSTRLLAAGFPIISDDVVPIEPRTGVAHALGVMPRLRHPLPTKGDPDFKAFIAAHSGPASERFQYINTLKSMQIPYGPAGDITNLVFLNRRRDATPTLEPIAVNDALKHIILRNFARKGGALSILDSLHHLAENSNCFRLSYDQAVQTLPIFKTAFSSAALE